LSTKPKKSRVEKIREKGAEESGGGRVTEKRGGMPERSGSSY